MINHECKIENNEMWLCFHHTMIILIKSALNHLMIWSHVHFCSCFSVHMHFFITSIIPPPLVLNTTHMTILYETYTPTSNQCEGSGKITNLSCEITWTFLTNRGFCVHALLRVRSWVRKIYFQGLSRSKVLHQSAQTQKQMMKIWKTEKWKTCLNYHSRNVAYSCVVADSSSLRNRLYNS